jgi:hypothetical protein
LKRPFVSRKCLQVLAIVACHNEASGKENVKFEDKIDIQITRRQAILSMMVFQRTIAKRLINMLAC